MADLARILFVDQSAEMGGAELSLLDIATHFKAVSCVCLFQKGAFERRLAKAGVDVRILQATPSLTNVSKHDRGAGIIKALFGIASLVYRLLCLFKDFDVVYANTQNAFVISSLACIVRRRPLIWHLRDILTSQHFSKTLRRVVILFANYSCNLVICNSFATKDAFVSAGGRARTLVIHNGIDADEFDQASRLAAPPIRSNDACFKVGLFGRLAEWKGQHVAIAALENIPRAQLLIVGGALFGEEAYETTLRQQTASLGLEKRVIFMGNCDNVPFLMQNMDVIVHTSIGAEPFGRVIVEGMLAGKAVVATRAGGALEIVEDQISGLLVEPGNVDALSAAISHLIEAPDERARLGAAGRRRAISNFSLRALLRALEAAVSDVAATR